MTEEHKANVVNETLLAQTDSLYVAGPVARQDLSGRLTAANKDIDLTAIDVFTQAPLFLQTDTQEVTLKKMQQLRAFCVGLGHKVLK